MVGALGSRLRIFSRGLSALEDGGGNTSAERKVGEFGKDGK